MSDHSVNLFMGLTFDTWADIYALYVHENDAEPKDLQELRKFWCATSRETPEQCLAVGLKLNAAYNAISLDDRQRVFDMIESFMSKQK